MCMQITLLCLPLQTIFMCVFVFVRDVDVDCCCCCCFSLCICSRRHLQHVFLDVNSGSVCLHFQLLVRLSFVFITLGVCCFNVVGLKEKKKKKIYAFFTSILFLRQAPFAGFHMYILNLMTQRKVKRKSIK